jgi:adenine-specific DNA-methyltransferase
MKSYKHKDKRVHIPSKEEAGYEEANPKVEDQQTTELPLNPVVHRGQDPELYWKDKYGNDNREELLKVDIRSLYRYEHISPEMIVKQLYKTTKEETAQLDLFSINELFGNALMMEEEDKVSEYYKHLDGWSNRLIQGDSLLVMASLLEREGMAGKVQTIYFDPPYGIKYGGNWQMKLNSRDVKDGSDEHLSGEPEMIKAYRDTWENGIHSYLSYLRDRLLVAKELLTESGSCFVQISDENMHLVRNLMDEVFGSENFVRIISVSKTAGGLETVDKLSSKLDYIIWYGKNADSIKYQPLYEKRNDDISAGFNQLLLTNGEVRGLTPDEKNDISKIPSGAKIFKSENLTKPGPGAKYDVELNGKIYNSGNRWWGTPKDSLLKLIKTGRVRPLGNTLRYLKFISDFPYKNLNNLWDGLAGAKDIVYVVQTNEEIIKRCILMTSDPGDLVLDPTCGSGTTAFVSEQWGRRWITIDTSRIALNIAKTRLLTASFPYYKLHDTNGEDIRQGFIYKKVPHITLKSIANNEPADEETLFDQPENDNKKMRVSGPFTVETLQSLNPVSPNEIDKDYNQDEGFEQRILEHLKSAGIKNGIRNENAVFTRIDPLNSEYLHYIGYYNADGVERVAYIHIGPKFGAVSKQAVSAAIKECRQRGLADWLVILGFSFESNVSNETVQTANMGSFEVTKVRMHDDLMQDGLLKKDKKAASFVTIGEPEIDVKIAKDKKTIQVEIKGLDIYDPIRDEVKPRDVHDIAYWMVDDDYDGSNFIVKQVFFCGGDKDEFDKWKKGLSDLSDSRNKRRQQVQSELKIEIDEEAFERLYGHISHPIEYKKGKQVAVRVISQFGEESTKVVVM